jgi:hypothetical protein
MKAVLALIFAATIAFSQDKHDDMASCPMHAQHMKDRAAAEHHHGVEARGDHAMGFSHEKTTHHFRLFRDGGAIEVQANDLDDSASLKQIRTHLTEIAGMFTAGDFETPMLIHDQTPPGVPELKRLRERITYKYETTKQGGMVRITTRDPEALAAVHEFLKFQITDHKTGDPVAVEPAR